MITENLGKVSITPKGQGCFDGVTHTISFSFRDKNEFVVIVTT